MPKINPLYATVTTYRSNSTVAFFDTPKDATPQDCKEVTSKLIGQAYAILSNVIRSDILDGEALLQLEAVRDTLLRANESIDLLDIAQAVAMAQVEG